MNRSFARLSSIPLACSCILALLLAACQHAPSNRSTTQATKIGAAETDITPPIGYRMAGYFSERLATGTHDPLKAKALVLSDGKEQLALVFCDLVGMSLN